MKTKIVLQLDDQGYFVGKTFADESPLEVGVWLMPRNTVEAEEPIIPEGMCAKWNGSSFDIVELPKKQNENFNTVELIKPSVVSMRQARKALFNAGKYSTIDDAINNLPEPQRTEAKIDWEYAQTVERSSSLVLQLSEMLGMTASEVDDLFLAASKL